MDLLTTKTPKQNVDIKKNSPVKGRCLLGVYRLEMQSVMFVFSTKPLTFSLTLSPFPLPCVNKYTVFTYTMCKGRRYKHKFIYRSIFLDDNILLCLLCVLSFYGVDQRHIYKQQTHSWLVQCSVDRDESYGEMLLYE